MFWIYILKCRDGSLYTGMTSDLEKRLQEHNNGKGSKYVRSRLPFQLVYKETHPTKSHALKREIEIKNLSRQKKQELIQ